MSLQWLQDQSTLIISISGAAGVVAAFVLWIWRKTRKHVWQPIKKTMDRVDEMYGYVGKDGKLVITAMRGEVRQRTLMCTMGVGEMERDHNGRVTRVNAAMCRLTGRPESDFLGGNWVTCLHPEDRSRVSREWDDAIKDHRTAEFHCRWLTPGGSVVWTRSRANPVPNDGTVTGWIDIIHPAPLMDAHST